MRITKLITKGRTLWKKRNEKRNVWTSDWRICIWILGLKGLRITTNENSNLGHWVNTSLSQAVRLWGRHKEIMWAGKNTKGVGVRSESKCWLLSPSPSLPPNLLPLSDFTLHYLIACKPLLGFHHPNLAHNHSYAAARILLKQLVIFLFLFQPQTVDEVTVDPVQDDIEIVNEGEGTDAFAVSTVFLYIIHILIYNNTRCTEKLLQQCNI